MLVLLKCIRLTNEVHGLLAYLITITHLSLYTIHYYKLSQTKFTINRKYIQSSIYDILAISVVYTLLRVILKSLKLSINYQFE